MKIILLTVVGLFACACSSGGGSGSSASPQAAGAISGTYVDAFKNETTGDCYVSYYSLAGGDIESGLYWFKGCGPGAYFIKFVGTYSVNGNSYTPNYTYETCVPPNGITETYSISSAGNNQVSIDINYSQSINGTSNIQLTGTKEDSIGSFLASYGMIAAMEDLNCDVIPGINTSTPGCVVDAVGNRVNASTGQPCD